MAKNKLSYKEAIEEIEEILRIIEHEEPDVDQLTDYVKRASELMKMCREKLRSTEKEIDKVLKDMDAGDKSDE